MSDATTSLQRTSSSTLNRAEARSWLYPHPMAWAACWLMIATECIWIASTDISFSFGAAWGLVVVASVLLAAGVAKTGQREHLAMIFLALAFFIIFGKQARVFNYLSVSAGFPLVDTALHQIDTALGFDWLAVVAWVNRHPLIQELLLAGYNALSNLTGFTLVTLVVLGMFERLREFLLIFAITIVITLLVGLVFPAIGAYAFYQPGKEITSNIPPAAGVYHLPFFVPLRDGTMTLISLDRVVGTITFPSFHTTMAIILTWAVRRTPVFWIYFAINTVMIASTISHGGHYFIDLPGGALVAIAAIYAVQRWQVAKYGPHARTIIDGREKLFGQ